ncbi:MAG: FCD domain-containing protein [Burkholderiales bacterium]
MRPREIAALRRLVRDENAAYARGDRDAGLERSLAFHHRIGELSGNPGAGALPARADAHDPLAIALYERSGVASTRTPTTTR